MEKNLTENGAVRNDSSNAVRNGSSNAVRNDGSNREMKASVFTSYFSIPENAADLYAGLHHETVKPEDIVYTTLDDVLFMVKKNDMGFTVKQKVLIIAEHQSTLNMNMPLRSLQYLGRTLELLIPPKELYKEKQIMIPTPEFYSFYNGTKEEPAEKILKLSDAYLEKSESPMLELLVKEINVNLSAEHPLLKQSHSMYEYATFVERTRNYLKQGMKRRMAIQYAIEDCIRDGVMAEFLRRHGSEVVNMLFTKYNVEDALEVRGQEKYEEGLNAGLTAGRSAGIEEGRLAGISVGLEKGIRSLIEACQEFGISPDDIVLKLVQKFSISKEEAEKYLKKYGK